MESALQGQVDRETAYAEQQKVKRAHYDKLKQTTGEGRTKSAMRAERLALEAEDKPPRVQGQTEKNRVADQDPDDGRARQAASTASCSKLEFWKKSLMSSPGNRRRNTLKGLSPNESGRSSPFGGLCYLRVSRTCRKIHGNGRIRGRLQTRFASRKETIDAVKEFKQFYNLEAAAEGYENYAKGKTETLPVSLPSRMKDKTGDFDNAVTLMSELLEIDVQQLLLRMNLKEDEPAAPSTGGGGAILILVLVLGIYFYD